MNRIKLFILYICLVVPIPSWADIYIITHISTPIETISKEELATIYLLKKTYWDDSLPITPINLSANTTLHQQFTQQVFKRSPRRMETYWNNMSYKGIKPPVTESSENSVHLFVKRVPGAIAYTTKKPSDKNVKILFKLTSALSALIEKQADIATFILNIVRFTTWPERGLKNKNSVLNMCIIGVDNSVQQSFEGIDKKVTNSKTLQVIDLTSMSNLEQCQLLYISELERNKLIPLLAELQSQPILTIGQGIEFLKSGGMIGLNNENGKLQLNINLPIVKQSEVVISSRLLKLSNIVNIPKLEQ
jgi:hypothetical protein